MVLAFMIILSANDDLGFRQDTEVALPLSGIGFEDLPFLLVKKPSHEEFDDLESLTHRGLLSETLIMERKKSRYRELSRNRDNSTCPRLGPPPLELPWTRSLKNGQRRSSADLQRRGTNQEPSYQRTWNLDWGIKKEPTIRIIDHVASLLPSSRDSSLWRMCKEKLLSPHTSSYYLWWLPCIEIGWFRSFSG